MKPRIELLKRKLLLGKHLTMSLVDNKTHELWKSFMQQKDAIENNVSTNLFSVQIYSPTYFSAFNPNKRFDKWAAIEVTDYENTPDSMEKLILPQGQYAVFDYKGPASDKSIFSYIFEEWLPKSGHLLDDRPHFEMLGEFYSNTSPESEEEIWIPIKII